MDDFEFAEGAEALPGLFADRLSATTLANIRGWARGGEWTRR